MLDFKINQKERSKIKGLLWESHPGLIESADSLQDFDLKYILVCDIT